MAQNRKSQVLIDCILVEINKTRLSTFGLKRNVHYKIIHFNF